MNVFCVVLFTCSMTANVISFRLKYMTISFVVLPRVSSQSRCVSLVSLCFIFARALIGIVHVNFAFYFIVSLAPCVALRIYLGLDGMQTSVGMKYK